MDYDVVVAGAGPVGLMLAAELRLGGASVKVLERETARPPTRYGSLGARALNAPSVHALHLRGLLPAVEQAALWWFNGQAPPEHEAQQDLFVGHFAGIGIRAGRLEPDAQQEFLGAGVIAQADLEAVLEDHATRLGAHVARGTELVGFEAGAVHTTGGTITTKWLVGADGGRSTVRKLAGFEFPGEDPVFTGRQAIVELDDPAELTADGWQRTENGSYTVGGWAPEAGQALRIHTVEFTAPADTGPVTREELQASLRRTSGTDVKITKVHQATRYSDTTRQAATYRQGNVLLAGDAAHVHSPAGGQGLNVGLGDAVNLGWKIALVAREHAPETLLDTYTEERHPIGAWAQRWSMAQTALTQHRGARADALREVITDLLDAPDGATHVVTRISGTWQHYGEGDNPLIGHRVPDFPLDDGTSLTTHFRAGKAVLLDAGANVATTAAPWSDRLTITTARPTAFPDQPLAAFIRPDGYVAWVTPGQTDLRAALTTWLGRPRTVGAPT